MLFRSHVVGHNMIEQSAGIRAGEEQPPHVRDIKESCCASHGVMFFNDRRVLNWHVPTTELDHASTASDMPIVKDCLLERSRFGHKNVHRVGERKRAADEL